MNGNNIPRNNALLNSMIAPLNMVNNVTKSGFNTVNNVAKNTFQVANSAVQNAMNNLGLNTNSNLGTNAANMTGMGEWSGLIVLTIFVAVFITVYVMFQEQIEKLLVIAWWNWDEQKIKDNAMDMWSDNINDFINKFYENK